MALIWKALLGFVFVAAILCGGIRGDAGVEKNPSELDRVNQLLAELEARLSVTDSNLKLAKQESFEKSKKIASLESEVEALQKRASGDLQKKVESLEATAEESASKVHQLEADLKKSRDNAQKLQEQLEASEAKVDELTSKLSQAEKSNANLRKKSRDAEEARKIAESLLLKAESEAASKAQELYKVYEAWLPPWAAGRLAQIQATSAAYWAVHGEPYLKKAAEHASQHATTAKEWAKPHIHTLKKKVSPTAKKYWETVAAKGAGVRSEVSKGYRRHVSPYVKEARKQVAPHIKALKQQLGPHVDRAAVYIRPYYGKAQEFAAPHIEKLQKVSDDAVASAVQYHSQMEKSVRGLLMKHELSAEWAANKQIVWFLAMAVLVLPAAVAMGLILSSFSSGKRATRPSRGHGNGHKRSKRSKHQSSSSSSAAATGEK